MIGDAAAALGFTYVVLRYFNVAGADPQGRSGQSTPTRPSHQGRDAGRPRPSGTPGRLRNGLSDADGSCLRDYIQVSDLADAHRLALDHLRGGGESLVLNCGYGLGYSVLEVIEVVKRVSGKDFEVRLCPRRPGDPARIVAGADRIRERLGWAPRYDNLDTIVTQALAWEDQLSKRTGSDRCGSPRDARPPRADRLSLRPMRRRGRPRRRPPRTAFRSSWRICALTQRRGGVSDATFTAAFPR